MNLSSENLATFVEYFKILADIDGIEIKEV